jgi:hypothetical protein
MIEVIGAGWGRTGTSSTQQALNILGYNCYHMMETLKGAHEPMWLDVLAGESHILLSDFSHTHISSFRLNATPYVF